MHRRNQSPGHKPRELRRRVVVPARLRDGASWSDACILNVSSRGLMIHTGRPVRCGSDVEIRRGDYLIVARVMWRDGGRAGLRAQQPVPVEEIVLLGQAPALPRTPRSGERRRHPRPEHSSRVRGRAIEFAGVLTLVAMLAAAGVSMIDAALARPLAAISTALGS
jgi:hypothetical protein